MSNFEKIYQINPEREKKIEIEKHPNIELSDEMLKAGFVYRVPYKLHKDLPEYLKQKYELAIDLLKKGKTITLDEIQNEPPKIDMPIDEVIKGNKNEKRKSQSTKGKPKKISS